MRSLTAVFLTLGLGLALISASSTATANPPAATQPGGRTIPTHGRGELTFTSIGVDPVTGFTIISGDMITHGTFGRAVGTDTYEINPATGAYVGVGTRTTNDGSTFEVLYQGQFINATDTIGAYTIVNGTGRFQGMTGVGTFRSVRWASGLGSSTAITGTATF